MILMAGVGYATYLQKGLKEREAVREVAEQSEQLNYMRHWDGWTRCPNMKGGKGCWILDPMRSSDILLIGDSHAGHLASGLASHYSPITKNVTVKLRGGCFPVFEMSPYFNCEGNLINEALADAINNPGVKSIILSGYPLYALAQVAVQSGHLRNGPKLVERYMKVARVNREKDEDILQEAMNITLSRLVASKKQIYFIVDVPDLDFDPTECVALRPIALSKHERKEPCSETRKSFEARYADYHRIIDEAKTAFPVVKFIDAYKHFCDDTTCYGSIAGQLLYMTDDHLTVAGSRHLIERIARELPN
jgi:hypothetical protein